MGGWQAQLRLRFAVTAPDTRTRLAQRSHRGPLVIQRPFYPEGDPCHVYIVHPPGGLVGGDRVAIEASCGHAARVLVTTPAATKFYRSAGASAEQRQRFTVGSDCVLEWLPQETIAFDGARARSVTRVDRESGARYVGWDILCLGRPAAGERFRNGTCESRVELWRDGMPLWIDCLRIAEGDTVRDAAWGLQGMPVTATLLAVPAEPDDVQAARAAAGTSFKGGAAAVSLVGDVLVCRYLGECAGEARRRFSDVWKTLRSRLLGRPACPPRIWST
jgi:urease accessory protein